MHVREMGGGRWRERRGIQDTAKQQGKKSTVQLKKGEKKQIQNKSFSPQSISSITEEEEKRGKIQKSGQTIQQAPRSTKSAKAHRSIPTSKTRDESKRHIYCSPPPPRALFTGTQSFENLHLCPSRQRPSLFTNMETEAQGIVTLHSLTTHHTDKSKECSILTVFETVNLKNRKMKT